MAARIGLFLVIILVSLVKTAQSQTGITSQNFKTYGCKRLYQFSPIVTEVIFRNSSNITIYSTTRSTAVITIPANSSVSYEITVKNSTSIFRQNVQQNSSETCCSENVLNSTNCYTFNLTCPKKCLVSSWPNFVDFYKTSKCSSCLCQYCYIGKKSGWQQLKVPLDIHWHLFDIFLIPVDKNYTEIILPRKQLQYFYRPQLTANSVNLLPLPQNDLLQRYFTIVPVKGVFEIKRKQNLTLPSNGEIQLYFQPKSTNAKLFSVMEYVIMWYLKINCTVVPSQMLFLNDPLLKIKCHKEIRKPIIYNVSNPNYQMKGNRLYTKNLSVTGNTNITLSAMYAGLKNSEFIRLISFNLSASVQLLTVYGCKAEFNFILLNFTKLTLSNEKTMLSYIINNSSNSYIINLQPNETNTFRLNVKDQNITYTATATSSGICCNETVTALNTSLCFSINLTCPGSCRVSNWPEYKNFQKISKCDNCVCQYCYTGFELSMQQMLIPLNASNHKVFVKIPKFIRTVTIIKRVRKQFFTPVTIYKNQVVYALSALSNTSYEQYFHLVYENNSYSIRLKDNITFPSRGRVQIYFYPAKNSSVAIQNLVDISWFSPVMCNVSNLQVRYLNDPLVHVNCENPDNLTIELSVGNPIFRIENNLVYLKSLTEKIPASFTLKAMFKSLPDSLNTITNITTPTALTNLSLLTVYGCKAVFNLSVLNYTKCVLYNQNTNLLKSFKNVGASDIIFHMINLQPNIVNKIALLIDDQQPGYFITATPSGICCNNTVVKSRNCFTFNLTCPNNCAVSVWPIYPDFYKASDCNSCICQYCYVGGASTWYQFILPLKSSVHLLAFQTNRSDQILREIIRPRREFLTLLHLPNSTSLTPSPFPRYGLLERYFLLKEINGSYFLQQKSNNLILPQNGKFQIHFQQRQNLQNQFTITTYNVTWFSPINCNVTKVPVRFRNDPLLHLNCENAIQKTIIYNMPNSIFRLKGNSLYLKDLLMVGGPFNFSITAMYEGLDESATTVNVSLILEGQVFEYPFLYYFGCNVWFNITSLNHSRVNIFSQQLGLNIDYKNLQQNPLLLPSNETIEFVFQVNNDTLYTLTVVSPDVCCNLVIRPIVSDFCFEFNFMCPNACAVSAWPKWKNLYKFSKCGGCVCSYCLTSLDYRRKYVELFVPMKSSPYQWTLDLDPISKNTFTTIIRRNKFLPRFDLRLLTSSSKLLPFPSNSSFDKYFTLLNYNSNVTISPKVKEIPTNGQFQLYFVEHQPANNRLMAQYNIFWYDPLHCKIKFPPQVYLNDPFLSLDCFNAIQWPIIYNLSDSNFWVKKNFVYAKDITSGGFFNLSITAMFRGVPDSAATYTVSFNLKGNSSFIQNYGCKSLFNMKFLNPSQQYDLFIGQGTFGLEYLDYIEFPPNKTNIWYIYWKEQNMKFTMKTISSEICCNVIMTVTQERCYTIEFPCIGSCAIVTWPEFQDFYKTVNCGKCSCQYCCKAERTWYQVWFLPLTSYNYLLTFGTPPTMKTVGKIRIPRKYVMTTFNLSKSLGTTFNLSKSLEVLPRPLGSYFNVYKNQKSDVLITPMPNKMLPKFGQQRIYLQTWESKMIIQYDISWYSGLHCDVLTFPTNYLNLPLVMMNCTNLLKIPIVYYLANPKFQMKGNKVYLSDLATTGTVNLPITAMYKDMNESATTYKVSLTLTDFSLLKVYGCQAVFNKSATNRLPDYKFLNIYSPTLGYNKTLSSFKSIQIISLLPNTTNVFHLRLDNQTLTFKFIAKTPKYCCKENITYHKNFSCYTLRLDCPDVCTGIYPETQKIFVISNPTKCSSVYCYRGQSRNIFNMYVPLKTSKLWYTVEMNYTRRSNETIQFRIGRRRIQLMLPDSLAYRIWSEKYEPYFNISTLNQFVFLVGTQPSVPEGNFNFSVLTKMLFSSYIQVVPWRTVVDYNVYVFKNVSCSIVKLSENLKQNLLPVCKFNCVNTLNVELNFTVYNGMFLMKDSTLYMRMPPQRNTTVYVNVMYGTLDQSLSTYPVNISTKQYFISVKTNYPEPLRRLLYSQALVEEYLYRPGKIFDALIRTASIKLVTITIKTEFLEYFTPVGRLFITNLSAVQDNRNRYTFTCYTNSTLNDLTYEWYWNDEQVLRGLSSSMENGKSKGTVVFNELNINDSGNITCHVKGKKFIPDTKTKPIKMKNFPLVELKANSSIIENDKPVTVACYLLPAYNLSKLVFKVNGQTRQKMNVTLSDESRVSCYGVNDVGTGEVKTLQIFKSVGKKVCQAGNYGGIDWPKTVAGNTANATCREEYSGIVSRLCSENGIWGVPNNSSCVKKSILDAKSTLSRIAIGISGNFDKAVESLANATKESIKAEDISETIDALDIASIITNKSKEVSKKEITNFVNVVNNLVKEDTKSAWTKLEEKNQITASSILKKVEDFGNIASQKVNETVTISTKNLVLEIEKVEVTENIQFPTPSKTQPKWVEESNSEVFIPSSILKDKFNVNESVSMNAVIFRNMKDLLPSSNETDSIVNSYVLAISLGKPLENLTENISLTFSHLSQLYQGSSCKFWDFSKNPNLGGSWSGRGCAVMDSNSTYTICSCDHLTNFAILMNPVNQRNSKVLGIITKVGCSISIVALILTIIIYVISWKYVTSQDVTKSQSVLLMNLCVSLIISYLIFLTLVEGPREKNACTAIAAILQYFFLVVFFTMLAEGIDMAIALTVVFAAKFSRLPWLLVSSWVGPAIIVGISLLSTQTKGFGNDVFCWLTPEDNVIWAFIAPALIIIVINIVCVALIVKRLLSAYCMLRESVKERLRTGARAIGILTPLMGFTWIFGVFAVNENLVVFEYIFTVASSLQGFFIFITYCVFNNQIKKNFWKRRKPTSQATLKTSSQSTSGTKLSELSSSAKKQSYFLSDSSRESSEIQSDSNVYDEYRYSSSPLRYSDNGLKRPIMPYYLNASLKTSLNNLNS